MTEGDQHRARHRSPAGSRGRTASYLCVRYKLRRRCREHAEVGVILEIHYDAREVITKLRDAAATETNCDD